MQFWNTAQAMRSDHQLESMNLYILVHKMVLVLQGYSFNKSIYELEGIEWDGSTEICSAWLKIGFPMLAIVVVYHWMLAG